MTKSSAKSHQKFEKILSKTSTKTSSKLLRNLHQNLNKSCEDKLQYFDEKSNCCERRKFALVEEKSKVTERAVSPSRVTLTVIISKAMKTCLLIDRKRRLCAKKFLRRSRGFLRIKFLLIKILPTETL